MDMFPDLGYAEKTLRLAGRQVAELLNYIEWSEERTPLYISVFACADAIMESSQFMEQALSSKEEGDLPRCWAALAGCTLLAEEALSYLNDEDVVFCPLSANASGHRLQAATALRATIAHLQEEGIRNF